MNVNGNSNALRFKCLNVYYPASNKEEALTKFNSDLKTINSWEFGDDFKKAVKNVISVTEPNNNNKIQVVSLSDKCLDYEIKVPADLTLTEPNIIELLSKYNQVSGQNNIVFNRQPSTDLFSKSCSLA